MMQGVELMHQSSKKFGKDMTTVLTWKERLEKVGFINVQEEVYKVCRHNPLEKLVGPSFLAMLDGHNPEAHLSNSSVNCNSSPKAPGPKTPNSKT